MGESIQYSKLENLLQQWVRFICGRPRMTLLILTLITSISIWYSVTEFKINSKLTDIIVQDTQWRKDFDHFKATFPELVDTAVIVISGKSALQTYKVAQNLSKQFASKPDQFIDVYSPAMDDFFYHHSLLYQSLEELYDTADELALAQPFLTRIANDNSLNSLLRLINDSIDPDNNEAPPEGLLKVVKALSLSANEQISANGIETPLPWIERIEPSNKQHYQLITLRGKPDYNQQLPHHITIERIRNLINSNVIPSSVQIRLTGEAALSHEEITAAKTGVKIAGIVSLIALTLLVYFGIRCIIIASISLVFIIVGGVWTSALGLFMVDSFNTLSLLFMVMFFGLSIDFFLHFSLRLEEVVFKWSEQNPDQPFCEAARTQALTLSISSVGPALLICALTTSASFLSFSLTDYRGLSELGIISAGGMLVAIILSFTLLPALYQIFSIQKNAHNPSIASFHPLINFLSNRRKSFIAIMVLTCVGSFWLLPQIQLEGSVLALRDNQSESVSTLAELQKEGIITDYSLFMYKQQPDSDLIAKLKALPTVDTIRTIDSYIPEEMDEKHFILENLQFLLESAVNPLNQTQNANNLQAINETLYLLKQNLEQADNTAETTSAIKTLVASVEQIVNQGQLIQWERNILQPVNEQLDWLRNALFVEDITFEQLPKTFIQRLQKSSPDGNNYFLNSIAPKGETIDDAMLRQFITDVQTVTTEVTGRPIVEVGISDLVKQAFTKAILIALTSILIILLIKYRSLTNVIWVLIPLFLTTVITMASVVLFDISFNLANILVVPLIFGLSVDNGIHIIDRYSHHHNIDRLVQSSTPRAVLLSSLTTLCSFASLSLSPHVGTETIGILLTVAILIMFVVTVIILPVIIKIVNQQDKKAITS